ncbi:hypothetical protein [Nonomuraea lactucae]|uniref:hypothetical protein n=1 Tax=Nonomuraea lactucae TaxID=2249762 RepID=UPI001963BBD5|nr:hypothetical protein [Nonomuraea lactucae]
MNRPELAAFLKSRRAWIRPGEDGLQRLLWFTAPPGTQDAAQLELLSVIGTHDLASRDPRDPHEAGEAGEAGEARVNAG